MSYGYNSQLSSHGIDTNMDYGRDSMEEIKKIRSKEDLKHKSFSPRILYIISPAIHLSLRKWDRLLDRFLSEVGPLSVIKHADQISFLFYKKSPMLRILGNLHNYERSFRQRAEGLERTEQETASAAHGSGQSDHPRRRAVGCGREYKEGSLLKELLKPRTTTTEKMSIRSSLENALTLKLSTLVIRYLGEGFKP